MTGPIAYGIDFGTTNSVLSVAWPDRVELMSSFGMPSLRSVIYLDSAGTRTAGEQALRQFLADPDVRSARVMMQLKASLSHEDLEATDVFGRAMSVERLASIVFRYLKRIGDRHTGADVTRAVIGFPVAFPDTLGDAFAQRQALAVDRLCAAANEAGFTEVVPIEEPAAAAVGEDAELYVTLDFGGGTFDVAVVRSGAEEDEVLALEGVPIGGEELNALLFEAALEGPLGLDAESLPARHRVAARALPRVLAAIFEGDFPQAGLRASSPRYAAIREGGFLWDLYQEVEEAKLRLSRHETTTIRLVRAGIERLEVDVARTRFERAIAPRIADAMRAVDAALARAGVAPGEVELVTLTGGSSRIPSFRRAVAERFPTARIEDRDPFGRVAEGLAQQAQVYPW